MSASKDGTDAIVAFLAHQLQAARISARGEFDRGVVVFEARNADGSPGAAIEISEEALEDLSAEAIIADLSQDNVIDHLRRDSTMRLSYNRDRTIPHFERLTIRCEGRHYRVIRDAHHNVTIFDSNDRPLSGRPRSMLVMDASIFRKPLADWCAEIRTWRGRDQ